MGEVGQSTISIILLADFVLLGIVFLLYIRYYYRERRILVEQADRTVELQQKIYETQVLKEISERIGYSLDTNKIIEIITTSLGNLLAYDTVSYLLIPSEGEVTLKFQIENSVSHGFVSEVREKVLLASQAILNKEIKIDPLNESITGNILDDNLDVSVSSYFNLPVVISGKLVGLINVASSESGLYGEQQAAVMYSITNQAANAVSRLHTILESEKDRLTSIIYSMTDGVITLDANYKVIVSNPAVRTILNLSGPDDPVMFDIVDALAGRVDLRTKIDQSLSEHKPISINNITVKERVIDLVISPVRNKAGEQLGAAVVFKDVTNAKALENVRQEFTAMMVHELRAPLTAMRWASENLMGSLKQENAILDKAKVSETLTNIDTSAGSMLELVNDLLDVAKIESGKFELNIQEYDLVLIITDEVNAFKAQAEARHLSINLTLPDYLKVKCDRVRIAQVFNNLLSNAIKYTDSGSISIYLTKEPGKIIVAVQDSGIGITREDLGQLFSKFRQLKHIDNTRKGTGLGLAVSKGIVEAHGGQIWAESAGENLGSTFYFSLPV